MALPASATRLRTFDAGVRLAVSAGARRMACTTTTSTVTASSDVAVVNGNPSNGLKLSSSATAGWRVRRGGWSPCSGLARAELRSPRRRFQRRWPPILPSRTSCRSVVTVLIRQPGRRTASSSRELRSAPGAARSQPADFNGDGALDPSRGDVLERRLRPALSRHARAMGLRPQARAVRRRHRIRGRSTLRDFNGDGLSDIAVTNSAGNSVSSCCATCDRTALSSEATVPVGTSPQDFAVADFNGDGRNDVAWPTKAPTLSAAPAQPRLTMGSQSEAPVAVPDRTNRDHSGRLRPRRSGSISPSTSADQVAVHRRSRVPASPRSPDPNRQRVWRRPSPTSMATRGPTSRSRP